MIDRQTIDDLVAAVATRGAAVTAEILPDPRIKLLVDGLNEACDGWERQYNRDLPDNPRADIARLRALADGDVGLHGPVR